MPNSRKRAVHKTLAPFRITPSAARELLEDLANFPSYLRLPTEPPIPIAQYRKFARAVVRRCPQFFTQFSGVIGDEGDDFLIKTMIGLGEHVRRAWRAREPLVSEWIIYELRRLWGRLFLEALERLAPGRRLEEFIPPEDLQRVKAERKIALKKVELKTFWGWLPSPPPPPTVFEEVMIHFQRALPQAKYCPNPDCPAPYFFVQRRSQKYHKACAWYGQQQAKRRYWHRKGKKARAQQIQAKKNRRQ